ncbi:MAG: GldG family protein, partial [Myxococcota bacterium]
MTPRARERSAAVGIVALMVIAVLGNVLAARHYQRWDVTAQQLFTLSPATRTTLRRLAEPIDVYVFIPRADPLHLTVRHLLDGYRAETDQLRLTFVDPDADPAAFLALQQRFELSAVETEGGAIAADAVIVVARGDRRHFIGPDDLFEVADDRQARPRVERALTAALRSVDGGTAPPVCFTTGHRELPFDGGGLGGLIPLRDWLEKANFEPRTLPPLRDVRGPDPIDDCALVVVAGPAATVGPADAERLRRYFDEGGSLLVAIGPELDEEGLALRDGGLGPLLAAAGLSLRSDIVFEQNPARMLPNGQGELFVPVARRHPIT